MEKIRSEKIGIIGSGLIGRAWSMLFTSVGYQVMLYDILTEQIDGALNEIERELQRLELEGKLRGKLTARQQFACISSTNKLEELMCGAIHIQECIPERIEMKRSLYAQLDGILSSAASEGVQTIICSSTSTFMPSLFSADLKHKSNVLVAHPLNPPYFIPLIEIVPTSWTHPSAIERTRNLMIEIGQKPIVLRREIQGFATNRIQYSILNEIWHLIEDGIVSVADIDTVMSHGLGLRYALLGPLATAHLNANGIADYLKRFGGEIYAVSQTLKPPPKMENAETLTILTEQCNELIPPDQLGARRSERDEFLQKLNELKANFN